MSLMQSQQLVKTERTFRRWLLGRAHLKFVVTNISQSTQETVIGARTNF
jgi:hypothetical protein